QADHAAMDRIDRNGRVQKQAEVAVIAGPPEAVFAGGMAGEVEFRRVLDRQHVTPGRSMAGKPSSGGEHLAIADRTVIEKATKGQLLVAVIRQPTDAGGRVLTHRIQQIRTDAPKPRIAKAPKIILKHANRPPTKVRCHRITVQRSTESIRSCANAVATRAR